MRQLTVLVLRPTERKRFLGGYRSRRTGQFYHHAVAQTPKQPPADRSETCRGRGTQTRVGRHFLQQTAETTSTQMTGVGVYVPDLTDRLVAPRPYVTADEFLKIRNNQVSCQY